jgi:adenylate cyclase
VGTRWRSWLLVLAVGGVAALVAWSLGQTSLGQAIERKTYDWRWRTVPPVLPPSQAVLVLVDEPTLREFARTSHVHWPLPRDLYCPVLAWLSQAGARAIVLDVLFPEDDELDGVFAECIQATQRTVLAWSCDREGLPGTPPWSLPMTDRRTQRPSPTPCPQLAPVPVLAQAARTGGRIDMLPDEDGVMRAVPPVQFIRPGRVVPVLGLAALAVDHTPALALDDGALHVDGREIPLDREGRVLLPWRSPSWRNLSFSQVYAAGQALAEGHGSPLDARLVRGKVVFLGTSATSTFDLRVTPLHQAAPGVQIHAAMLDALTSGIAVRQGPRWLEVLCLLGLCLACAAGSVRLPSMRAQAAVTAGLLGLVVVSALWAFSARALWLPLLAPVQGLALAFTLGTLANYRLEGRARRQIRHAFAHYLSPAIIEQLVRDPSRLRLGGERREITAFFSDIQGFTTVAEQLEPGELVVLLNECLGAMTDVLLEEAGTVDKYIGDAIVAMFGAPLEQPDHALRACRAALACQARLETLRVDWQKRDLPALRVRIGLNSGQALVGNMGSRHRFDFTMMGDTVNLASRLESAAGQYALDILCGEETAARVQAELPLREIDLVRVKGKRRAVRIFQVRAQANPRLDEAFSRGLLAFRARQWQAARLALDEALAVEPDDGPARVLRDRVDQCIAQPPPEDWDGAWDLRK